MPKFTPKFMAAAFAVVTAMSMGIAESQGEIVAEFESISGVYQGPGVACPQFRLTSGETVSLSGSVPDITHGGEVTLRGTWMARSKCMQGREFRVEPDA